jgi:hypothetical protein
VRSTHWPGPVAAGAGTSGTARPKAWSCSLARAWTAFSSPALALVASPSTTASYACTSSLRLSASAKRSRAVRRALPGQARGPRVSLGANKRLGDSGWAKGGYVVLTDRRLLLIATGFGQGMPGGRGVETIPIESILSVDASRWIGQGIVGIVGAPLRVNTGGGEISIRVAPTAVADAIAAYLSERIAGSQQAPPASGSDDVAAPEADPPRAPLTSGSHLAGLLGVACRRDTFQLPSRLSRTPVAPATRVQLSLAMFVRIPKMIDATNPARPSSAIYQVSDAVHELRASAPTPRDERDADHPQNKDDRQQDASHCPPLEDEQREQKEAEHHIERDVKPTHDHAGTLVRRDALDLERARPRLPGM